MNDNDYIFLKVKDLYEAGVSPYRIGHRLHITADQVSDTLEALGVKRRTKGPKPQQTTFTDADMVDLYHQGLSIQKIADRVGLSYDTVRRHLSRSHVSLRTRKAQTPKKSSALSSTDMALLYQSGMSLSAVGRQAGLSTETVARRLQEESIVLREAHAGSGSKNRAPLYARVGVHCIICGVVLLENDDLFFGPDLPGTPICWTCNRDIDIHKLARLCEEMHVTSILIAYTGGQVDDPQVGDYQSPYGSDLQYPSSSP